MSESINHSWKHFFRRPFVKMISFAAGLALLVFAMVWARAFYCSMQAYHDGEAYFERQQYIKAITFFDRSIHWYTPFNPYVRRSAERLWEIGLHAEQEGDIRLSLIAIRSIRQGFYGTRSFYTPGKDWISRCDIKIASLMNRELDEQQQEQKLTAPFTRQKSSEPDILWTLVLELGFFGWIGSVIGFLIGGLTEGKTPSFKSKLALLCGIAFVIFYTLWIVGMMRA